MLQELPRIDIAHAVENSFRNFHAKGMDYICIKRSPKLTMKLYVFEGDVSKLLEVVNPHDHRYNFDTLVLAGRMQNMRYGISHLGADRYQWFEYLTPLNGGSGFKWKQELGLKETFRETYAKGGAYRMLASEIHTIRMVENETVLLLRQYSDVVPLGVPTMTFTRDKEPPSLSGLYERWTEGELMDRLKKIEERTGLLLTERV